MKNQKCSFHPTHFLTTEDENISKRGISRLSVELANTYRNLVSNTKEAKYRDHCIQSITKALQISLENQKIVPLKSYKNNFYFEEITFVILNIESFDNEIDKLKITKKVKNENKINTNSIFSEIKKVLHSLDLVDSDSIIFAERYDNPYIKCRDEINVIGFQFFIDDIERINRDDFISTQIEKVPNTKHIFVLLKYLLKIRRLDSPYNGLKPYYLYLMILHFSLLHPLSKSIRVEENLGPIMMDFLQYYGIVYPFDRAAFKFNQVSFVQNVRDRIGLSFVDPITNKKGGEDCRIMHLVRDAFSHCYKIMNLLLSQKLRDSKTISVLWFPVDETGAQIRNEMANKLLVHSKERNNKISK